METQASVSKEIKLKRLPQNETQQRYEVKLIYKLMETNK